MITLDELKDRYSYDPDSGVISRLKRYGRSRAVIGPITSTSREGYVIVNHGQEKFKAHRLAFLFMLGRMPDGDIDHIDGVRSNNKWSNLRAASRSENMKNIGGRKNNASGFRGVSFYARDGRWKAQAQIDGKKYFLGHFDTPQEASEAYETFAKLTHGRFYRPPA